MNVLFYLFTTSTATLPIPMKILALSGSKSEAQMLQHILQPTLFEQKHQEMYLKDTLEKLSK